MRNSKRIISTLAVAAGLVGLVGCAKEGVKAKAPEEVARVAPERVTGAYVPAGTEFTVSMNQALGTELAYPGQSFTASVEEPLRASDGTIVVPAGSLIRGHVARVESGETPVLALAFDIIQTQSGSANIQAKIRGAEKYQVPGAEEGYDPRTSQYDAFFHSPPGPGAEGPAYGFYRGYEFYDQNTREIRIPSGAEVRMELTQPLVSPGSSAKSQD